MWKASKKDADGRKEHFSLPMAIIISSIFVLLIFTIPADGLDGNMRGAMAVFVVAAILWISEAVPHYITSFVIVLMEVILIDEKIFSASDALQPFFNTLIALFFGGFVLSIALNRYGLDRTMAYYVLSKAKKSPARILIGMMAITAFLSMWMSNTATTALMMAMALPVYATIPREERFRKALILGIPFAANIGGMGTPVGTPPNAIIINELAEGGYTIGFFQWMLMALPVMGILLMLTFLILFYSFKPKKEISIEIKCESTRRIDKKQLYVLIIFVITVSLWLLSSTGEVKSIFQSSGIIALIPVIAFFGAKVLDKDDLKKINWDVLILMGGGMSLGGAIEATGLGAWIIGRINHTSMSFFVLMTVFAVIAVIMSTFMSNTSTAALMAPIVFTIASASTNTVVLMVALALACSMAMALPVSTPPNAIAYGTEEIPVKDMMVYGTVVSIVGMLLLILFFGL